MTLNELAKSVHTDNVANGFWDKPRLPIEVHMLIVTELAEATEAVIRNNGKEAEEVLDAMIRILDYAGNQGWDVDNLIQSKLAYNRTRGYRHGKEQKS